MCYWAPVKNSCLKKYLEDSLMIILFTQRIKYGDIALPFWKLILVKWKRFYFQKSKANEHSRNKTPFDRVISLTNIKFKCRRPSITRSLVKHSRATITLPVFFLSCTNDDRVSWIILGNTPLMRASPQAPNEWNEWD